MSRFLSKNLSIFILGMFTFLFIAGCKESSPNIPEWLPKLEIEMDKSSFEGYVLVRKTSSPGAMIMYDGNGQVVWFHESDTVLQRVFTPYKESYVTLHDKSEISEVHYNGDTLKLLKWGSGGFDRKMHHEILKDSDGNYVGLTHEYDLIDFSSNGGLSNDTLKFDGILKLSSDGEKLWSWRLTDYLDPRNSENAFKMKLDWGHANALSIDDDGNYLISFRDFNEIWKLDSSTGAVVWKYDGSNDDRGYFGQHAVHKSLSGEYLLFDNGSPRSKRVSRAFGFKESQNGNFVNNLNIELPDSLFSWKQGSVYQFETNKFLFCSSMRKKLAVTDSLGSVLWMANTNEEYYRAYYIQKGFLN